MNVLGIFSGLGGFELGLQRAGARIVAMCEIDPYARRVLARHWPEVPIYEDVRLLTADRLRADQVPAIDIICGGFPCQDISNAGGMAGIDGARSGLWSEYHRLIGELRPNYALIENVTALLVRGLGRVLCDLAAVGYDAWWDCVPAAHLGAPHNRDRFWACAYPQGLRREQGERSAEEWRRLIRARALDRETPWSSPTNNDEIRSGLLRVVDGLPHHVERLDALGNAVSPIFPELLGRAIMQAEGLTP